jgi:hypothetical protein
MVDEFRNRRWTVAHTPTSGRRPDPALRRRRPRRHLRRPPWRLDRPQARQQAGPGRPVADDELGWRAHSSPSGRSSRQPSTRVLICEDVAAITETWTWRGGGRPASEPGPPLGGWRERRQTAAIIASGGRRGRGRAPGNARSHRRQWPRSGHIAPKTGGYMVSVRDHWLRQALLSGISF